MLVLVFNLIAREQRRDKPPRQVILNGAYTFMAFSLLLALINGYVQSRETQVEPVVDMAQVNALQAELVALKNDNAALQEDLRANQDQLLKIRAAVNPLLGVRGNIVDRLPDIPEREMLRDLVDVLQQVVNDAGVVI